MPHKTPTTDLDTLRDRWPYGFQYIENGYVGYGTAYGTQYSVDNDTFHSYLLAFLRSIDDLNDTIADLYHERFIASATDEELEKLARPLGVTREAGESDDDFRYRVQLRLAVATSNGTPEDIETVVERALSDAAVDSTSVEVAPSTPELRFLVDAQYIDDVPISEARLETLLERAMPAGTGIDLVTEDVFTFAETDADAPSYGAGFGEGVWSG
jgi:hypothetical protein